MGRAHPRPGSARIARWFWCSLHCGSLGILGAPGWVGSLSCPLYLGACPLSRRSPARCPGSVLAVVPALLGSAPAVSTLSCSLSRQRARCRARSTWERARCPRRSPARCPGSVLAVLPALLESVPAVLDALLPKMETPPRCFTATASPSRNSGSDSVLGSLIYHGAAYRMAHSSRMVLSTALVHTAGIMQSNRTRRKIGRRRAGAKWYSMF
jgi:hypothetical protein